MAWADPAILEEIVQQSRAKVANPRLRRLIQRAAVQTGLVESHGANLQGGDADSEGWRQERRSIYRNPRNVHASVGRFISEALQHYEPGERSFELAADVQRPAAQFRGRYRDVRGEARRVLAGAKQGMPGGGGQLPQAAAAGQLPQGQSDVLGLLGLGGQAPRSSTGPAEPSFSARAALPMPQAARLPASSGGPAARPSLADLVAKLPKAAGDGLSNVSAGNLLAGGVPEKAPVSARDGAVERIKAEAELIDDARVPYLWGGGHGEKQQRGSKVTPLDCSGAVSRALGINPRVSGEFESWGRAGRGKRVTIYANAGHVLMEIDGHFWGTSRANPKGGAGWIPRSQLSKDYLAGFVARHPRGM